MNAFSKTATDAEQQETYTDDTGRVWHPHRGYWCWKTANALAKAERNNADLVAALKAETEADQAQAAFENACGMPDDGSDDRVDNLGAFALELRHRAREMRKAAISKATGAP